MNRQRDKRAAVVLVLLLLGVFILGQSHDDGRDRRTGSVPATAELAADRSASALHD